MNQTDYSPALLASDNATMLEIGCGIGSMTRAFSSRFVFVYGMEISAEMIAQDQPYLADYPNVHLLICNGTDLS